MILASIQTRRSRGETTIIVAIWTKGASNLATMLLNRGPATTTERLPKIIATAISILSN